MPDSRSFVIQAHSRDYSKGVQPDRLHHGIAGLRRLTQLLATGLLSEVDA